ncbi:MAG: aldo/keto reductase [Chloroflexi bacterium]|nr:aldo/keto reductase [Chloroflexota bacterium]
MTLPDSAYRQFTPDMRICRVLNGMWQVSGAHGSIDPGNAVGSMIGYHDAGFTTWDLADHYGPAEDFIGAFRQQLAAAHGEAAVASMQAFTKWVPRPVTMSRATVERAVEVSLQRMQVQTLDLLQFHWWEYGNPAYLDALKHLADLRDEGKLRHVALTNFDTEHLARITEAGIRIVSNQVQFSLIDRRPEVKMLAYCEAHDIQLLTYGTLCGGLLSERYLDQPEPGYSTLNTASLRKYKQMIDVWGGWGLFQRLLATLKQIAERHERSIANVATRYILDKPSVAGVIAGARLGISDHRADNARVFDFTLSTADLDAIQEVTAQTRDLFQRIGDCGDEYRR